MTNFCHLSSAAFSELNHFLYVSYCSFTSCMIVFIEVEFAPFFRIIIIMMRVWIPSYFWGKVVTKKAVESGGGGGAIDVVSIIPKQVLGNYRNT